jgi:hypothetical protein
MTRTELTIDEANLKLERLADMPVSFAWKGYGTAIFLELGSLSSEDRRRLPKGEVTIYVSWDWRVEKGNRVLFGSSNSKSDMADGIATLVGSTIKSAAILGMIPDLSVVFSNGTVCSPLRCVPIRQNGMSVCPAMSGFRARMEQSMQAMVPRLPFHPKRKLYSIMQTSHRSAGESLSRMHQPDDATVAPI